jgi:hypothetical protein
MNGPVQEVRKLRQQLAEKDHELAELRGLVQQHLVLEQEDHERALDHERDLSNRSYQDGFTVGHDVALGAFEEGRPFVAGVREGFEAGYLEWQEVAEQAFSEVHQRAECEVPDLELEAG